MRPRITKQGTPVIQGILAGERVLHGYRFTKFSKTKRLFRPNVCEVSFFSEILNRSITFPVSGTALNRIEALGGIDNYLLKSKISDIAPDAIACKWRNFIAAVQTGAIKIGGGSHGTYLT
ncbi:50S ribosomal protein L28 [Mitosporidium daphniae]|uniref:50S ribosomal protein L28 n=1 Tax=Mitosporidium daphniae TaxID=1485682 RepID=A0A098VTC3_9MICR|nr:50S ribosomal protein L28 [Mitosporidium daphniae]KGG52237.1 50S ribosomal protein L28 [Mitosporidium daphniae]|eukprot:XP_013238664.1 50S ribosomal protein L28 [Mitosporidium daphniae]